MESDKFVVITYFVAILVREWIVVEKEGIVGSEIATSSENEPVDACAHECAVVVDAVPLECANTVFSAWICAWFFGYL